MVTSSCAEDASLGLQMMTHLTPGEKGKGKAFQTEGTADAEKQEGEV